MVVESCFFFQAEDGIRDLVRSRGLGDVYKRQGPGCSADSSSATAGVPTLPSSGSSLPSPWSDPEYRPCLLYTSDAADERSSVDLGGRRIINKKKKYKKTKKREQKKEINIRGTQEGARQQ